MTDNQSDTSTPEITVIEPKSGWDAVDWREVLHYRDLFYFLVMRDVKVLYKQTILGFGWAIIRPVMMMVIFSVIFGGLAKVPSDELPYAIFSFAALVPWTYFQNSTTLAIQSLVSNSTVFTKVYFPRLIIPFTPVVAGLVDFVIAMVILVGLMLFYGVVPNLNIVFLPLLVLLMIGCAGGIGLWLSALAIQYRDVKHAVPFLVQLLMYAAPVVWPTSLISENFPEQASLIRCLYGLYPMAGVVEGFRACLLGATPMPWDLIGMSVISTLVLLISGTFYFRRKERIFADVF